MTFKYDWYPHQMKMKKEMEYHFILLLHKLNKKSYDKRKLCDQINRSD